jgi:hypothetical protein
MMSWWLLRRCVVHYEAKFGVDGEGAHPTWQAFIRRQL